MASNDHSTLDSDDGRTGSPAMDSNGPVATLRTPSGNGLDTSEAPAIANADIELSRRAVPIIEADDDVCSVCLDVFTQEDPGNRTTCGHCYHLQCIMQWAQRSRECPMCFKPLRLQDSGLNELLPFGEYVPPHRFSANGTHVLMGLDAWELERLLHRLATNGPNSSGRRERRYRNRTHILPNSAAAHIPSSERAQRARSVAQPSNGSASSSVQAAAEGSPAAMSSDGLPSSWPPAPSHVCESMSPRQDGRGAGENLRSRWAAMSSRCRESLSKTTRELKGRLAGGAGGHPRSSTESEPPSLQGFAPSHATQEGVPEPSSSRNPLSS